MPIRSCFVGVVGWERESASCLPPIRPCQVQQAYDQNRAGSHLGITQGDVNKDWCICTEILGLTGNARAKNVWNAKNHLELSTYVRLEMPSKKCSIFDHVKTSKTDTGIYDPYEWSLSWTRWIEQFRKESLTQLNDHHKSNSNNVRSDNLL